MRAKDIMTVDVLTVTPETAVKHASQIMLDRSISGLPVLDDEETVVGMITEGDLMRRFELTARQRSPDSAPEVSARGYLKGQGWKVGDAMTREVVAIDEETPIGQIAALFEERGIKRVPVLRQGRLVGIVSRADLLHGLATAESAQSAVGDESIRLATLTRLRDDAGIRDLAVTVKDGIVHLWGSVGSEAERAAATAVAENVRGAGGVESHLRIVSANAGPDQQGLAAR